MAKGIAHFGILFSLIIYSGHVNALLVSDLLISEIMANPAALSDARGEWFELYNPTDQEINLRDTWIGDDGRDSHKIETDLLILPTEYLTLARSVSRRSHSFFLHLPGFSRHPRSFFRYPSRFQSSSRRANGDLAMTFLYFARGSSHHE